MRYKDLKIVENAQPGDELCAGIIRLKNKQKRDERSEMVAKNEK